MSKSTKYEQELVKAIQKFKWMRWAHIDWSALSFVRSTAYVHSLEKSDIIKEAFFENRAKGTNYLLQKWIQSENATLQIAAFKIIAEPDDHKRLNQSYVEQQSTNIDLTDITTEDLERFLSENE